MKNRFRLAYVLFIVCILVGSIFGQTKTYASIDPAEIKYFSDEYEVSLEQSEEVWVEDIFEGCEEDNSCGYWERQYDESVAVRQNGTAALKLNKQADTIF